MATQRLTVATVAGEAAAAVAGLFERWRSISDAGEVDRFGEALRNHGLSLPIVYFAEWVDRWLMGDLVPGPNPVEGRRFQATCLLPQEVTAWAGQCGKQFREQEWLAARLREAAMGWGSVAKSYTVVVVREVIDVSTTDEEVRASLDQVPDWLCPFVEAA